MGTEVGETDITYPIDPHHGRFDAFIQPPTYLYKANENEPLDVSKFQYSIPNLHDDHKMLFDNLNNELIILLESNERAQMVSMMTTTSSKPKNPLIYTN